MSVHVLTLAADAWRRVWRARGSHLVHSEHLTSLDKALNLMKRNEPKRSCPTSDARPPPASPCTGRSEMQRTCLSLPRVFAMSLVWATDSASAQELRVTMGLLGQQLDISNLFTTTTDSSTGESKYQLTAMVCYYGHHYMAIAASAALRCWLLFDDTRVTRIGNWADVTNKCVRNAPPAPPTRC